MAGEQQTCVMRSPLGTPVKILLGCLVTEPHYKRQIDRLRRTWEDNIRTHLKIQDVRVETGFQWVMIQSSEKIL